ncbi:hypothetical protein CV093_16935 [Oceanobacillus sp. 143]|uniref:Uncharacterized protein n=1 Tax=Oceanobacillus zhaokaii TaxID=2052660 RepID=A0A345PJY5_9BACI|nr:hypothetical protein [Oceanobacillus zhaokaii]AXI10315.1 hypothetical protein CUC15_15855 [Oceanobacillus zhaokaii]QGS69366.1 hypothetical protein CV093_16935 [Oceanobacillus sp. 143]
MSNNNILPTTQRSKLDVALELTQLYVEEYPTDADELEYKFSQFYALVSVLENTDNSSLRELVPEEILNKIR